jgi:hypothetical protein
LKLRHYTAYIKPVCVLTITVALLAIIGWFTGTENLKSVAPGLPSMKVNTAICFIFLAILLFLLCTPRKGNKQLQILILLPVLIIGTVSLTEDLFALNTGLDELLTKDNAAMLSGSGKPGRMATTTALCFILLSLAFTAIVSGKKRIIPVAQYTLHFVTLISFITSIGYLYNLPAFYKLSFLSSMALNTSILFFIFSISASLINYQFGITGLFTGSGVGSLMARRLFPLIAIMVILLGFLRMQLHWHKMVTEDFGIALFATSFVLVSLWVIYSTAKYLNKVDVKRNIAEEGLKTINKNLEKLVDERTKNIQQISERLSLATRGAKTGIWDWDILQG